MTPMRCFFLDAFFPLGEYALSVCVSARSQNTVVLSVRCWGRRATAVTLKVAAAGATVAVAWLVGRVQGEAQKWLPTPPEPPETPDAEAQSS